MRYISNDGEGFTFDFDFGFGPPKRGRRRRHRRPKWKMFERGDLKFVILRLLSERPMHGYEVMKALEEESGGYYKPSPGSVYPTLQMLEDAGYLQCEEKDGKKIYSVTDAGREYLEENEDVVDDVFERVEQFTDRYFGREMRSIKKSFSRMAQLTFDEAFRWGAEREDLKAISEILENAADDLADVRKKARARRRAARRGEAVEDEEG